MFPAIYFHIIEPAYKDHLCIRSIFCWSLEWSLFTSFNHNGSLITEPDRGWHTFPDIYSQLLSSRDTSDLSDN